MREMNTVLVSGYAKMPSNVTAEVVYSTLVVSVVFDRRTGIILETEASVVTALAKRFISNLTVGYDLNDGPDKMIAAFEEYYLGNLKRALETAMRMVFSRFDEYKASRVEAERIK